MSRSLNRVQLIGNLGKDAEVRFTPSGIQMANFSIATTQRWKDKQTGEQKEQTEWHRLVLWRCEHVAQYLTKGKQVYVEGRLQTRKYTDKENVERYTTEIVVDDLMLLGGKPGESSAPAGAQRGSAPPRADDGMGISDDDVPF